MDLSDEQRAKIAQIYADYQTHIAHEAEKLQRMAALMRTSALQSIRLYRKLRRRVPAPSADQLERIIRIIRMNQGALRFWRQLRSLSGCLDFLETQYVMITESIKWAAKDDTTARGKALPVVAELAAKMSLRSIARLRKP